LILPSDPPECDSGEERSTELWTWILKERKINQSTYKVTDTGPTETNQAEKMLLISFCLQSFFHITKLVIYAVESLFRKHKYSFRAVSRLDHWDTGTAVQQIVEGTS